MSRTSVSILALTESCISKFDSLLASYTRGSRRTESLESRLADFNLWADGVGALAKPGASLDSRLQGRVNDLALVKNVLIMLADSLDHCVGIVGDKTICDGSDHHEAIENIDSAIKNLALIGVAIRRTGQASRNRRVDKTFNPDNHQELRTHLECIIRLRPTEEALFHQTENGEYIAQSDNSKLSDIQSRHIEANLRRRHKFLIAHKRSKTQQNVQIRSSVPVAPLSVTSVIKEEPSVNTRNADEANNQNSTPYPITRGHEPKARTISSFSLASTAEGTLKYTPASRKYTPSITKTQITFIASDIEFPKAPSICSGREIMKCPCCCQILPIGILQNPKSWKQHIVEDLCPYTCIAKNCPTPQLLFCTRNEWESHVKKTHLPRWQCPFCEEQKEDYPTMESMGCHLRYAHREELLDNSLATLLSWSTVQTMGIESCPLCSSCGPEDSPELVDHVLRHAYDFALRALPWPQPTEYDLNILPGGFTLPKDSDDVEDLQRWIKGVTHDSVGLREIQLSGYDKADHSTTVPTNLFEYSDYFLSNTYFDDQSEDRSSKLQFDQSNASSQCLKTLMLKEQDAEYLEVMPTTAVGITQSEVKHDETHVDGDDTKPHDAIQRAEPDAITSPSSHEANIEAQDSSTRGSNAPRSRSEDPSWDHEPPLLNIVRPTPVPSPDSAAALEQPTEVPASREIHEEESLADSSDDDQSSTTGKSLSWGQKEMHRFVVESPEARSRAESPNELAEEDENPRPRLSKSSRWGKIAAAIAAGTAEPISELDRNTEAAEVPAFDDEEFAATVAADLSKLHVPSEPLIERRRIQQSDFEVAIICALTIEANAIYSLFDTYLGEDDCQFDKSPNAPSVYYTGTIGDHYVVLMHTPITTSEASAAIFITNCKTTFPNIKLAFVVGICGAVPISTKGTDIMLGDVIISEGVIRYIPERRLPDGYKSLAVMLAPLSRPASNVQAALSKWKGRPWRRKLRRSISECLRSHQATSELPAQYPGALQDKLFAADFPHADDEVPCDRGCDDSQVRRRRPKSSIIQPKIHFGLMASGDSVMKSARDRDRFAERAGVIAFETGSTAIWDIFPCIVVKGVCDYADGHKNEAWRGYASITAAACVKALLCDQTLSL